MVWNKELIKQESAWVRNKTSIVKLNNSEHVQNHNNLPWIRINDEWISNELFRHTNATKQIKKAIHAKNKWVTDNKYKYLQIYKYIRVWVWNYASCIKEFFRYVNIGLSYMSFLSDRLSSNSRQRHLNVAGTRQILKRFRIILKS